MKARVVLPLMLILTLALAVAPLARPRGVAAQAAAPQALPGGYDFLSDELKAQTATKFAQQDQLKQLTAALGIPAATLGQTPDDNQLSFHSFIERGTLTQPPGVMSAFAYIQPYQEPASWAYRNYCAAGAAVELLSHFDGQFPQTANIDYLGNQIGVNPNAGAWIRNIVDPVNQKVNATLGQDLNWYTYGQAHSLREFRWMLNLDIMQNGVPLITGVMTGGLPGWGSTNVGHIVAVYGYTRMPDGSEWISYADTAGAGAGYSNYVLHTWELNDFWRAASQNSGQVW